MGRIWVWKSTGFVRNDRHRFETRVFPRDANRILTTLSRGKFFLQRYPPCLLVNSRHSFSIADRPFTPDYFSSET